MSEKNDDGSFLGGMALGLLLSSGSNCSGHKSEGPKGGDLGNGTLYFVGFGTLGFLWFCGYSWALFLFAALLMLLALPKVLAGSIFHWFTLAWSIGLFIKCFYIWISSNPMAWFYGTLIALISAPVIWYLWWTDRKKELKKAQDQLKSSAEDLEKFMGEFREWEVERRAQGDFTMYCPWCRGEKIILDNGNPGFHACDGCGGTGLRDEKPSEEFIRDFQQWEMGKRVEGDETKYCMYCRGRKVVGEIRRVVLESNREYFLKKREKGDIDPQINYDTWEMVNDRKCNHCGGTGVRA